MSTETSIISANKGLISTKEPRKFKTTDTGNKTMPAPAQPKDSLPILFAQINQPASSVLETSLAKAINENKAADPNSSTSLVLWNLSDPSSASIEL